MQPNLITVKEAAAYLRIPIPTVYYLVQKNQLPAVQIGGRWRIKKDELDSQILNKAENGNKSAAPVYTPQILIVDDEPMIHQLIKDVLKDEPCQLHSAMDGRDAINKIRAQKFDLMFLDMIMPLMKGDEIYEWVVKSQPNLLVVIITAFIDNKVLDRVLSHGPVTILSKPINIFQLRNLTHSLLKLAPPRTEATQTVS
ncbi:MAG: response regulator [Verrucomicrobiota bacterium]|nr:response regulator [Verrucomicrobiota bacterium]